MWFGIWNVCLLLIPKKTTKVKTVRDRIFYITIFAKLSIKTIKISLKKC